MGWIPEPEGTVLFSLVLGGIVLFFVFFALIGSYLFIHVFTKDFVVPQMAIEEISAIEGWRRLLLRINGEKGGSAAYIGMKIVMALGAAVLVGIVTALSLSRRNEFLEGFNRFCEEVVIPKMEEIGSYIKKEHNVGYTIKPEKALVSEMGKELIRVVVMEILSSPRNRNSISVKADAGSNEVLLTEMHAGAWSSTPTTFSLKDITGDIVEKHILSVLRV